MPAMTLGVAEVEEQLRALRRRLNSISVQHGIYTALSVGALVTAVVIVAATWCPRPVFHAAFWIGCVLVVGTVVTSVVSIRRRWVDLDRAARWADRQGQLADRLATLADLRLHGRSSRLAPVLIGQLLMLRREWEPTRLIPGRVPRSLYVLVFSLFVLAGAGFVAPGLVRPPLPHPAPETPGTTQDRFRLIAATESAAAPDGTAETVGLDRPSERPAGGVPARADHPDTIEGRKRQDAPGLMADRVRAVVHRAFEPDGSAAAARGTNQRGERASRAGEHPPVQRPADAHAQPGSMPAGPPKRQPDGSGRDSAPAGHGSRGAGAKGQANTIPPPEFKGVAPPAGEGSSHAGLMGAAAGEASPSPEASGSFPLTIASSVQTTRQTSAHRPRGQQSAMGTGGAPAGSVPDLSQRQRNEEAVRKAQIPPEFEDLVRRVYSQRANR